MAHTMVPAGGRPTGYPIGYVPRTTTRAAPSAGVSGPQGLLNVNNTTMFTTLTDLGPHGVQTEAAYWTFINTVRATPNDKFYGEFIIGKASSGGFECGITALPDGFSTRCGLAGSGGLGLLPNNPAARDADGLATNAPGVMAAYPGTSAGFVLQIVYDGPGGKLSFGYNNAFGTQDPAAGTDTFFYNITITTPVYMGITLVNAFDTVILPAEPTYTPPSGFTFWGMT